MPSLEVTTMMLIIGAVTAFLCGVTSQGYSKSGALVGAVAVIGILIYAGVLNAWGFALIALCLIALFFGGDR